MIAKLGQAIRTFEREARKDKKLIRQLKNGPKNTNSKKSKPSSR